ncbi:MAG: T9SS type A sorting domain-containing protein [Bacteroidia bacterium]
MKRILFTILSLGVFASVNAQLEIEHYAIVPMGGHSYSSDSVFSMSYTIGQVEVKTLTANSGSLILTQGFQQPELINNTSIKDDLNVLLDYQLYPNPTDRFLTVKLTTDKVVDLQLELVNILGQPIGIPVQKKKVQGVWEAQFDLEGTAEGYYLLMLRYGDGQIGGAWKVHRLDQ